MVLLASTKFKENPHSYAPISDCANPLALAKPRFPLELLSVLMMIYGNGAGHHLIIMFVVVVEGNRGSVLRK